MSRRRRILPLIPLFGRQRRVYVDTLPEAALFPDEAARREAVDETRKLVERHWTFKLALSGLLFLLAVGLCYALSQLLGLTLWASVLAALLAVLLIEPLWYVMLRQRAARRLRARLNELGIPICEQCGYDLRSSGEGAEPLCPECGAVLVKPQKSDGR